jgi:Uncharacterized conserved protein
MARPNTKSDLLAASKTGYAKLWQQINSLSDKVRSGTFNFEDRDKNIRDIIIHLHEWHNLLLNWIESNMNNEEKTFLPVPYTWKSYSAMNIEFWEKHQHTPYENAKESLDESHNKVTALINQFSDDELFMKKHFKWTGTTNLGSYCVSATSSHYDWAMKKIKKHMKEFKTS